MNDTINDINNWAMIKQVSVSAWHRKPITSSVRGTLVKSFPSLLTLVWPCVTSEVNILFIREYKDVCKLIKKKWKNVSKV